MDSLDLTKFFISINDSGRPFEDRMLQVRAQVRTQAGARLIVNDPRFRDWLVENKTTLIAWRADNGLIKTSLARTLMRMRGQMPPDDPFRMAIEAELARREAEPSDPIIAKIVDEMMQ